MVFASLHNPVIDFGYGQTENQEKHKKTSSGNRAPVKKRITKVSAKKRPAVKKKGSKEEIRFEEGSGKSKDRA